MFLQKPVAVLILFVGLSWFLECSVIAAPAPQNGTSTDPPSQSGPYGGTNMQPSGSYPGPYMQPTSSDAAGPYMQPAGPYAGPYIQPSGPYAGPYMQSTGPYAGIYMQPMGPYNMPQYGPYSYNPYPNGQFDNDSPSTGYKLEAKHTLSFANPQFLNGVKLKLGK